MKAFQIILLAFTFIGQSLAQTLPDSCKLNIGTNLSGLADYGTEIPFVDLMKTCRTWYTKDINNSDPPFNSESFELMTFRSDGYPTHIPQVISGKTYTQKVATIWAITDGWKPGNYVVLFDGVGELGFWGGLSNLTQVNGNKYTFTFSSPLNSVLEMTIDSSMASDPVRNIRVLHADYETTYKSQPFNPIWLDKLLAFKSVRFMDWGQTNNWGQKDSWSWENDRLYDWDERSKVENYTWAYEKGVPYEMMIKLMNDYDLDGWVCVPHNASNNYLDNMARLFHASVEPERELTVEYSNEIWNWIFGQANWCYKYGCVDKDISWPEGVVPYVQNCLDRWTAIYGNDINRIKRAAGVQTGYLDVSNRIVFNLTPGSFDVVAPTYYFGLDEEADAALDALGASATARDVATWARTSWIRNEKILIGEIKTNIADVLNKPMYFYEGGQHLTPTPFGETPTYEQALLDIQRDTAIYNLYNECFDYIRTLQSGTEPLKLMNFSFIGDRSARYGSWGILESMNQDTSLIKAPKYNAIIKNMAKGGCFTVSTLDNSEVNSLIKIYPNPVCTQLVIQNENNDKSSLDILDVNGKKVKGLKLTNSESNIDVSDLRSGVYFLKIKSESKATYNYKMIKQ